MKTLIVSTAVILTALAAGCGKHHTFTDEGRVCAFDSASATASDVYGNEEQTFVAGNSINFVYLADACLSSSCDSDPHANCRVERNGQTLRVLSEAEYTEGNSLRGCTADCRFLSATCSSDPLEAGTYTIQHGSDLLTVQIPSTTISPCLGGQVF